MRSLPCFHCYRSGRSGSGQGFQSRPHRRVRPVERFGRARYGAQIAVEQETRRQPLDPPAPHRRPIPVEQDREAHRALAKEVPHPRIDLTGIDGKDGYPGAEPCRQGVERGHLLDAGRAPGREGMDDGAATQLGDIDGAAVQPVEHERQRLLAGPGQQIFRRRPRGSQTGRQPCKRQEEAPSLSIRSVSAPARGSYDGKHAPSFPVRREASTHPFDASRGARIPHSRRPLPRNRAILPFDEAPARHHNRHELRPGDLAGAAAGYYRGRPDPVPGARHQTQARLPPEAPIPGDSEEWRSSANAFTHRPIPASSTVAVEK